MKIPIKYIVEIGLLRLRNRCAKCDKIMDVPDYCIQLCKNCRFKEYVEKGEEE